MTSSSNLKGGKCDYSKINEGEMRSGSRGIKSHRVFFFHIEPIGLEKGFALSSELDKKTLWRSRR